jgi:hypothetical protein|tara:strand:- start:142 stop:543 length:402 start_codon:yes stop_codon:yes gene_type:complete
VTDAYVSITADVIIQKMKVGRRHSLLQRAREQRLGDDEIRDIAASMIAVYLSGWRNRIHPPQARAEEGVEDVAMPPPAATFGGLPINGGHDNAAPHHHGAIYWRQRTQVAVGDSYAAAGSWASLLRGVPTWGG